MSIAIKAENLSKVYQLGNIGTRTLSRDLERWYARKRGKEDPYLPIGQGNTLGNRATANDLVWSLKDINFEIEQGDAVGIIGNNGAGKSTLLKVLSRVTSPTTGHILGKGKIASLLEVGTGFHPELTGRENIYLNGAILGMRKREIKRNFEEIVDFAGVDKYIDTPVKRYSSGMYVRLAFSVAAHLQSEILIIDEVLAVGDAEFQKKCLGKMGDVSKSEGKTILFVSHNMTSIKTFCKRGMVLKNGLLVADTTIDQAIAAYNKTALNDAHTIEEKITIKNTNIKVHKILINGLTNCEIVLDEENNHTFSIKISGEALIKTKIGLECRFYDEYGAPLAFFSPGHYQGTINSYAGEFNISHACKFPATLNHTTMYMTLYLTDPGKEYFAIGDRILKITHAGYPMQNGHKFDYLNGAGLLFLKEG